MTRLAFSGYTDLHAGEVIMSDFLQQRKSLAAAANQIIRLHFVHKERGLQQRQSHMWKQPDQKRPALVLTGSDPAHKGLEDMLLAVDIQVVPPQDGLQWVYRQLQEVLLRDHLGEVRGDVVLSAGLQGRQDVVLRKIQDPDAAVQVEGLAQEAGTCIHHTQELHQRQKNITHEVPEKYQSCTVLSIKQEA